MRMAEKKISISVIIPTRNRAALLKRTLNSLAAQTLPQENYEVLVVDNGSTDDTGEVCRAWAVQRDSFRVLHDARPGLHVGRHAGLRAATAPFLVYLDDDIWAPPTWLEGMLQALSENGVGIAGGNNWPDYEVPPPPWIEAIKQPLPGGWAIPWFSLLDIGSNARDIPPEYVWGCNFGIRKDVLLKIGGFHPDGMPGELQHLRGDGESWVSRQCQRLGYRIRFEPTASIKHFVSRDRLTFEYLAKRAEASAISWVFKEVRSRNGMTAYCQMRLLAGAVRSWLKSYNHLTPHACRIIHRSYMAAVVRHARRCRRDAKLIDWINKPSYILE